MKVQEASGGHPASRQAVAPAPAPTAQRRPHVHVTPHGRTWEDPYHWLRDDTTSDPRVLAHLEAENCYAEQQLQASGPLAEALLAKMLRRVPATEADAPWPAAAACEEGLGTSSCSSSPASPASSSCCCWWWYQWVQGPWQTHGALTRTRARVAVPSGPGGGGCSIAPEASGPDTAAVPEVVLDLEQVARGRSYCDIAAVKVSPDGRYVAYAVDAHGAEEYDIMVRHVGGEGAEPGAGAAVPLASPAPAPVPVPVPVPAATPPEPAEATPPPEQGTQAGAAAGAGPEPEAGQGGGGARKGQDGADSSGRPVPSCLRRCAPQLEWSDDSTAVFCIKLAPRTQEPHQLWRWPLAGGRRQPASACEAGSRAAHNEALLDGPTGPPAPELLLEVEEAGGSLSMHTSGACLVVARKTKDGREFLALARHSGGLQPAASPRPLLNPMPSPPCAGGEEGAGVVPAGVQPGAWLTVLPRSDYYDSLRCEHVAGGLFVAVVDTDDHPDGVGLAVALGTGGARHEVVVVPGVAGRQLVSLAAAGGGRYLAVHLLEAMHAWVEVLSLEPALDWARAPSLELPPAGAAQQQAQTRQWPPPSLALPRLWVYDPGPSISSLSLDPCWPRHTPCVRIAFSNLTTPLTTVDLNLETRAAPVRQVEAVACGFEPSLYLSHTAWAVSADGTRVPATLACRRDRWPPATGRPVTCVLQCYGAYGRKLLPHFNRAEAALLDEGVLLAIAHARGGGELGAAWHRGGRRASKARTADDLLAVAAMLVGARCCRPGQLAAWGRSAGGLAVACALNASPGAFAAAVLDVPFLDVLGAMCDPSLPLTVKERPEWGDPLASQEEFDAIAAYSPYHNIRPGAANPPLLLTASLHDRRVPYWGPAKYVARVRAAAAEGKAGEGAAAAAAAEDEDAALPADQSGAGSMCESAPASCSSGGGEGGGGGGGGSMRPGRSAAAAALQGRAAGPGPGGEVLLLTNMGAGGHFGGAGGGLRARAMKCAFLLAHTDHVGA